MELFDSPNLLVIGHIVILQSLSDFEIPKVDMYAVFPVGATSQRKLRLLLDYIKQRFVQLSKDSLV